MPRAALPIQQPDGNSGPNVILTYEDPAGRPLNGQATIRLVGSPQISITAEVVNGRLALGLSAGRWSVGAMLRDPDGVRTYRVEEIQVPT